MGRAAVGLVQLEVLDFEGPTRWRWRLTEQPGGGFLADHQVDLDQTNAEYEAFTDLDGYLRWNAAPDRRLQSEAELIAQVGGWIGERVLGPVGPAILKRRPSTVRLVLPPEPPEAAVLAYRPLELAYVEGRRWRCSRSAWWCSRPGPRPTAAARLGWGSGCGCWRCSACR